MSRNARSRRWDRRWPERGDRKEPGCRVCGARYTGFGPRCRVCRARSVVHKGYRWPACPECQGAREFKRGSVVVPCGWCAGVGTVEDEVL